MAPSPARAGEPSNAPPSATNQGGRTSYAEAAASQSHVSTGQQNSQSQAGPSSSAPAEKKKKHRGGKKRRNRRQSFAPTADMGAGDVNDERPSLANIGGNSHSRQSNSFYRIHGNLSNTSLESEALLDHRDHPTIRTRRPSAPVTQMYQPRASQPFVSSPQRLNALNAFGRSTLSHTPEATYSDHEDDADDRTPLMSSSQRMSNSYGGASAGSGRLRRPSGSSGMHNAELFTQYHHSQTNLPDYDVNNPPSVPTSPVIKASNGIHDVMLTNDLDHSPGGRSPTRSRDALIDIDLPGGGDSPPGPGDFRRRMTATALEDVCFPHETMSELGHEDYLNPPATGEPTSRRRRRRWPDLDILDSWAHQEKEQRTIEGMRIRKVSEPLMVEGRLRPKQRVWHREASDVPFRFTYFNETFDNTIHSQTISELVQPGQTFRNLFVPDHIVLEDSSDDETDEEDLQHLSSNGHGSRAPTRSPSKAPSQGESGEQTRSTTPRPTGTPKLEQEKPKRYGPRPAWWLDIMSPTETEMKVISKTFGIHPLTSEDIMMQEQREKVELFKHYYFINYRTFEQDENSEDYLEPVNLYVVVFREGVISFHFSMIPHPANVRRRIRQLSDYLVLSPDWISYAIIDDITDAYAPLIERIEEEVDDIDEAILRLHSDEEQQEAEKTESYSYNNPHYEKKPEGTKEQQESGRDMLRRVGECRKKVMSLYRLLGNKADVIKGFAKRCNEHWDIAPRNEIGMYLGDIQDHIVTMTGNLSHYENLLSRAHSNYLAQINIRMNERQEKTSDILGKLTVLGTIVLPMNVVTGIWGMNCLVPGQDIENLNWFFAITGGLLGFGVMCYLIAKRVYGIV